VSFIRAAALKPSSRFFENCSLALYRSWRLTEVADGSGAAASIVAASFPGTLGRQIHVPSTFSSNTTDELEDKRVSEDIGTGEVMAHREHNTYQTYVLLVHQLYEIMPSMHGFVPLHLDNQDKQKEQPRHFANSVYFFFLHCHFHINY